MSIVAVQKVTLVGLLDEKEVVLDELQELGCLHLEDINPEEEIERAREAVSEDTREAWRFLRDCPNRRMQVTLADSYDASEVQRQALQIKAKLEALGDESDLLRKRIQDVRPWGEFLYPSLEDMEGMHLWFYRVPLYKMDEVVASDHIWEMVKRDNQFAYVIVVAELEPEDIPADRVHVGDRPLSELEKRLEQVSLEMDELQAEREGLTRALTIFENNLNRLEDRAERVLAAAFTLDKGVLFAVQGWAPVERVDEIAAFAETRGMALRLEEPSEEDEPPTLLDNPDRWTIGESLVGFYMMPAYRLWDPSMVVLFSFAFFFAMILSDAGYGLIMAIGLFSMRKKLAATASTRRIRTLFTLLAGSTIVWGVLVGSYFGIAPKEGTILAQLKIMDVNDMGFMMKLSILIGSAHIILANIMDAWRQRESPAALAPLGWIVVIISALVFWMGGSENGVTSSLGSVGLVLGFIVVFIFSGAGQGLGFFKRVFAGVSGLTRLTKAFGDILSYLRLFALGLASASLAVAFNGLAADVYEGVPGLGILLAILVIVVGHTINFVLCIVSGFVHGLRLNLIEFFNWSVNEEGTAFRAFKKKETS